MTNSIVKEVQQIREFVTNNYVIPEKTYLPEYLVLIQALRVLLLAHGLVGRYEYQGYTVKVFGDKTCEVATCYGAFLDGGFEDNRAAEKYIRELNNERQT